MTLLSMEPGVIILLTGVRGFPIAIRSNTSNRRHLMEECQAIGKPNEDGTIGTCAEFHSRHAISVALARLPSTCGQSHMCPNYS